MRGIDRTVVQLLPCRTVRLKKNVQRKDLWLGQTSNGKRKKQIGTKRAARCPADTLSPSSSSALSARESTVPFAAVNLLERSDHDLRENRRGNNRFYPVDYGWLCNRHHLLRVDCIHIDCACNLLQRRSATVDLRCHLWLVVHAHVRGPLALKRENTCVPTQ